MTAQEYLSKYLYHDILKDAFITLDLRLYFKVEFGRDIF